MIKIKNFNHYWLFDKGIFLVNNSPFILKEELENKIYFL